ncbi:MAG: YhdP family protein, partial [Steroidobacteraceae bacterium]
AFRGPTLIQLAADVDFVSVAAVLPAVTIPLPTAQGLPQVEDGDAPAVAESEEETNKVSAAPQTPPATAPDLLSYSRMAFALRAQRVDDVWNASLVNLQLVRPESTWRADRIEARWSGSADGAMSASGKADRIVLDTMWPLLGYLPETQAFARVRALSATGAIENLVFDFQREVPGSQPRYSVEAQLKSVAVKPIERAPGFGGLSGALRMTDAGGEFRLAASDASFELPRMFREALAAQSVEGTVQWRRTDTGWTIGSDEVRVRSEDGNGVARFEARIARDGSSPMLDLTASGENLRVEAASKYIPAAKLGRRTMEWFDRAFIAGRVSNAELTYKGSTREFPFRKGEGTFLARGHVEGAAFDYQPGWAPARDVTADLEFRNQGMHIRSTGATVGGLRVTDAVAQIPDLKETRLTIRAAANGALREGLQLLQQSPLAPSLGEPFARLAGEGAMSTELQLYLPIKSMANRRIDVATSLKDASLSMQNIDAPIHALTGSLRVRNTLVTAADLNGQWLGGPLQVSVRSDDEASSLLQARGRVTAAQLQKVLSLPPQIKVTGETDWSLSSSLASGNADKEGGGAAVRIESGLQGLGIALPAPLGKSESETLPLQLALEREEENAVLARGSLGAVRALVRVTRDGESWNLDRGGIRADAAAPALPNHRGLRIDGSVDRFALEEWLEL